MSNLTDISDVIIIGSGPAGLSAAIYVVRAGLSVTVIEKEFMGTGQIADSSKVDNYLGIPAISGYDLGESFREHALSLGVTIEDNNVTRLTPVDDIWELELSDGSTKKARCVIYAAGCSHKKLQVENEEQYTGKGISYCAVCDGAFYKDKDVAVVGGGDTALSDALYLSDICANVYIIHRREEFRGAASLLAKLKERTNVHICTNRTVKKVEGSNNLERIILDAGADDFNEEEDSYEITTAPDDFGTVSDALSNEGITFASAEVTMIPQTMVELTSEDDIKKMRRILALLDEEDDVQNVYHNWDEPIEDEE